MGGHEDKKGLTPSRCFRGSPPACAAARFTHKAVASFGTATFASARLPYMYKDFSSVTPLMGARFASPAGEALRPPRTPSRFFKGSPPACAAARFTHKALLSLCFDGAFKVATNLSNVSCQLSAGVCAPLPLLKLGSVQKNHLEARTARKKKLKPKLGGAQRLHPACPMFHVSWRSSLRSALPQNRRAHVCDRKFAPWLSHLQARPPFCCAALRSVLTRAFVKPFLSFCPPPASPRFAQLRGWTRRQKRFDPLPLL